MQLGILILIVVPVWGLNQHEYQIANDRSHRRWLVPASSDTIQLPCADVSLYPFTNITCDTVKRVIWILPKSTSYIHLEPGVTIDGWEAFNSTNQFNLKINRHVMNIPEAVNGMYLCAALASLENDTTTFAWFYLRWGVGLYSDVPAMLPGGLERYYPF